MIDCLIICVKNKLFESVNEPHELMHQTNIYAIPASTHRYVGELALIPP
jgi:hypothetical protein